MKKLSLILVLLMLVLSSFVVSAGSVNFEKDYVKEGEFVLASFHAVKDFTAEDAKIAPLEDACYWVGLNAQDFNIKYTSFIGSFTKGGRFNYWNWQVPNGKSDPELKEACRTDAAWIKEFKNLEDMGVILTDCGVPYGVTHSLKEFYSDGMWRDNLMQTEYDIASFTNECEVVEFSDYNISNYYTIIEEAGEKYIIFQLEAYPGAPVIDWFNSTMRANPDKRAIVYTHSLLQASGDMYTQHPWTMSSSEWLKVYGSYQTTIKSNLLNIDKPHEGDQLWNDALSLHDNLLCVVTSNATTGKDIVTRVYQNQNGYDVLTVVASLNGGWGAEGKAFPILMKISADNKTIDLRYADVDGMTYVADSAVKVTLDNIASLPEPDPVTVLPKIPFQYNGENKSYINGYAGNVFKPNDNMTKAEACTIFARLLLGTQDIPSGYTTRFTDVKEGDWYYNAIAYLDQTGFFYTIEGDTYNPNAKITRAEFVELAYLSCVLSDTKTVSFKDVDESNKYYTAIMAAAASGLVNGYGDGTFGPEKTITRAEVVTVINRVLGLLANESTVSRENLNRVFGDINGHWAEYQILMASNDRVRGDYFKNIKKSVTATKSTIEFETKHVKVVISKKGAKVSELINLATGENVVGTSSTPAFTYLINASGANVIPIDCDLTDDGRIVVNYKGGYKAYFIVETTDDIITMALDCNLPSVLKGISFAQFSTKEKYSTDPDSYRLSSMTMNTNTNSANSANGSALATKGTTYTFTKQTMGAKMGITFGKFANIREQLKRISDAIDPAVGLTSTAGGPYALDNHDLFKDYVIMSSGITQANVAEVSGLAAKYSVGQIDIHQGGSTFIQAKFDFKCALTDEEKEKGVFGTAAMFKERIADVAHANGVQLGLHTYSSLVPSNASNILTDPKWQKQILTAPTVYTLRGKLSRFRTNIKTNEDASGFKVGDSAIPWNGPYTQYVLIDEEIIRVQQGTSSGFLNVVRGQCGTKAVEHQDGAEIRQFLCHYGMFQPIPGSELFYHIADLTAKAYNEGDFDMIYLDGFESFARDTMTKAEERYYYYAEFARRIVSQCIKKPIIEYSCGAPTYLWNARGRGGATDSANRGYKQHKTNHRAVNMSYNNNFYTSTFGWFHFNPDVTTEYKNTLRKTMFRDDLDHKGSLAIAWDISTVNDSFSPNAIYNQKRSEDNFAYYTVYSLLRINNYFSPEVKEQLKNAEYEYKVFQQEDKTWAFKEMRYCFNKINDTFDNLFVTATDTNPFEEQTPYVRIEQRYSTKGEEAVTVLSLDENAPIANHVKKHSFNPIDISDKVTLKVKVLGNGSETDAILIQLGAVVSAETGRNDYVIPLNFTGWREFVVAEADNADYGKYTFSGTNHASQLNYETFRAVPNMAKVNSITIKLCGDCNGVKIDDIVAYKTVDAPVKNPSVTVGSTTLTFDTELHSGDFIEYYPETGKAYQTYYEEVYNEETGKYVSDTAHVKEVKYTGSLTVPAGKFSYTYNAEALTEATTRARVGIGLSGKVIANPADWTAPEVNIPAEFVNYEIG